MHLIVDSTSASLQDEHNFRELDLTLAPGLSINRLQQTLATVLPESEVHSDHVWVPVDSLRELGHPLDATWLEAFAGMIDYAASYGWTRHEGREVRLHVTA
ncbi:hypothetical protein [Aeromicrobium wangtongii]|uniref:Uncharacterized protein n=1 Tax=Aeromicrobium wangtongii TaxID=2969247 RepID=A0ABY5M4C5_9ACTN|nr:hypothetical protein [Aeromicrobium wangtongii]MCD9198934.1 hypothetical protein [Aeromicrobium wangtongii]UUP13028.1 hypothetical protein NQV15_14370 [Aeromicrobium wangtongii]